MLLSARFIKLSEHYLHNFHLRLSRTSGQRKSQKNGMNRSFSSFSKYPHLFHGLLDNAPLASWCTAPRRTTPRGA